jgi:hypothetical protein
MHVYLGSTLNPTEAVNLETVRPLYGITDPRKSDPEFCVTHMELTAKGPSVRVNFSTRLFLEDDLDVRALISSQAKLGRLCSANPGYLVEAPETPAIEVQTAVSFKARTPYFFEKAVFKFVKDYNSGDGSRPTFPSEIPKHYGSDLDIPVNTVLRLMANTTLPSKLYELSVIFRGLLSNRRLSAMRKLEKYEKKYNPRKAD